MWGRVFALSAAEQKHGESPGLPNEFVHPVVGIRRQTLLGTIHALLPYKQVSKTYLKSTLSES